MNKWKRVLGYKKLYKVSKTGKVKSIPRVILRKDGQRYTVKGKLLKPTVHETGYLVVGLCNNGKEKQALVHRLVLEAFVGPAPKGTQCLHNNGIPTDNKLSNLSWGTPLENAADRERHGRTARGEKSGMAKLTDEEYLEIYLISNKFRDHLGKIKYGLCTRLAKIYKISPCQISSTGRDHEKFRNCKYSTS